MDPDLFDLLEQTLRAQGEQAGFDLLIGRLREQKNYPLVFEARLMQQRQKLGLPLIFGGNISDLPAEHQPAYEAALMDAARETGGLFLAAGDLVRAWPYFRAIGESAPIAAAIDRVDSAERLDSVLQIALEEGVNPRRGFELLLEHRGICRAIDFAGRFPDRALRLEFLRTLLRTVYQDLANHLKQAIAGVESPPPDSCQVSALIAGRDWLFAGGQYYTENSHLASLVQASLELPDVATLRLALELAEYALRLDPLYHFPGNPPFQDLYLDHAHYLRALLGEQVDTAIAHFRKKIDASVAGAAEALVALLARLGDYEEAIRISVEHLGGEAGVVCPSAIQLCQTAGDYQRLRTLARSQGDLLAFAAGILQG
jgi:tetratricopeptide (TPR) repeat protein